MAKDILVKDNLSDSMINSGRKLIERLDGVNAEVRSAFWLFFPDEKAWRLTIASPLVESEGPRKYYKKIIVANNAASDDEEVISLNDINVVNIYNEIVEIISILIDAEHGILGMRYSRNTINGVFIEDAYVYRASLEQLIH
jgi:hypothetical protein